MGQDITHSVKDMSNAGAAVVAAGIEGIARDVWGKPNKVIQTAENKLDHGVDSKTALSAQDKKLLEGVEHAIIEGNVNALNRLVHTTDLKELEKIAPDLRADMKKAGLVIGFNVGSMQIGDDKEAHDVGTLSVFRSSGGTVFETSTDARLGTGLGGPVTKQKDGTYVDYLMGLSGDPKKELVDMGKNAATKLAEAMPHRK
jgi:hypothetical protein